MTSRQNPIRIAFETLGCKLNQAETESLAREFMQAGYLIVDASQPADVYIINTCTVTNIAESKSRHLLRMAHRRNPQGLLVATGCAAERAPDRLAALEGLPLVIANDRKRDLLRCIEAYLSAKQSSVPPRTDNVHLTVRRTRSFIKVQGGCSNFCAYCVVPLARGPETSVPADDIIRSINERVSEGYKEVVLTGTRVGAYDAGGLPLEGLLRRILYETEISRIRLSSLQPREVSPDLVSLWGNLRLCPHFHFSLQSGSPSVLARMKRRYSLAEFQETVALIRGMVPDVAITTDVIVGFPGENAEEFRESYDFCRSVGFARIHVFPFSPRPGTEAARMKPPVAGKVKKERVDQMLGLARDVAASFHRRYSGRVMPVLFEAEAGGVGWGLTGNYIKVYALAERNVANRILPVRLAGTSKDGVLGILD